MPTIRDLFAGEKVRQGNVASLVTPEDLQQQQDQELQYSSMMPGQKGIKPAQALPMHEVNADPSRYPVEHAQKLHAFLKNAAGGPATGFVTSNPESHEMAKTLAKSGHLQHHGSKPGKAGGGVLHHWSMTPKGFAAIGMGGGKKPGQSVPKGARSSGPGYKLGGGMAGSKNKK